MKTNSEYTPEMGEAKVLMVQGTTSDAGKSTLVAGLCRLFTRQGRNVAPFKPQNMALNSAVTSNGGEIGRAQALQAIACGLPLHTDFNPILLKPCSDTGAQIIIQGKALAQMEAQFFFGIDTKERARQGYRVKVMSAVLDSFSRLTRSYELVLVEGAGSPAEINLREGDIANMGFAEEVDCPVIIIADIDKGGVFAHLVGTLALLSETEQERVKGFVINRFRGDISLLQPGLDWLEKYTKKPVLGVLPYLHNLHLDAEDALVSAPDHSSSECSNKSKLKVLVVVFPRISNHTDFDPLRLNPNVEFNYVSLQTQSGTNNIGVLPQVDLIILPGSKSVRADLEFLREQGWDIAINKHLRYGGKLLGICGGYQMLGMIINDSTGVEGEKGESKGLGLLPLVTDLKPSKTLRQVKGTLNLLKSSADVSGYEIHCGHSSILSQQSSQNQSEFDNTKLKKQPLILQQVEAEIDRDTTDTNWFSDGMVSKDGQIFGTYLHGLFDSPNACALILSWAGISEIKSVDINLIREQQLDRFADQLEQHLDIEKIEQILGG